MRTVKDIIISSDGKRRRVRALFDSGATINYLKPEIARVFPGHSTVTDPLTVGLGGRRHIIREVVPLTVRIEKHKMPLQIFHVADLKKFDAVIGAFFMEQWGVALDPKRKQLVIKRDRLELQEEF